MPKPGTSIPLHCSLCPKNPNFSDTSHLLTHISSKSHLSHRFKLQIRSQAEPEAKETLDIFDAWYENNGLDALLSERLAAKEMKKEAKVKREKAKATKGAKVAVKNEIKEKAPKNPQTLASTPVYRPPGPPMHLWPVQLSTTTSTPAGEVEKIPRALYETPTLRRRLPNFSMQETPHTTSLSQQLTTPWKSDPNEDENGDKKIPDSAKLKGVYWPGMDLFDSATPEGKRMRNQRKDGSVLEHMIATSVGTEPLEISYHPNGNFRTARDIFGPLSTETSPEKHVALTPKKRRTRKSVLKDVSVNIPRLRAPEAQMSGFSPEKRPGMQTCTNLEQPPLHPVPILNPFTTINAKFAPSPEENEEFRLTLGAMGRNKGKKRALNIFLDVPEESPGRTESPLEDFMPAGPQRFEFHHDGLPMYPSNPGSATYISPTPVAKPAALRFSGKENGQPEWKPKPSGSTGHVKPSQVFPDQIFNPLYTQTYAQNFTYGGHDFDEDIKPMMNFFGDFRPVGPGFDGMSMPNFQNRAMNTEFDSDNNSGDSGLQYHTSRSNNCLTWNQD